MDELMCPRCKTTKYRNPALKLMVNICGHALCENCVENLFVRGSAACPECSLPLRRNNFRLQLFEDSYIEKEVDIRKRILRDFNKKEEEFDSLREYNDYLEEVETIIFNLANNIDVDATKRKIDQYKKENKASIIRNKSKLSKDEEFLENLIEHEKALQETRKQQLIEETKYEKNLKKQKKEALIDQLMSSDMPADRILASYAQTIDEFKPKPTALTSGLRLGQISSFMEIPVIEKHPLYIYEPIVLESSGPDFLDCEEVVEQGYVNNLNFDPNAVKQFAAGGFELKLACQRALNDAFSGLYHSCGITNPSPVPSTSCSEISETSTMA